MQEKTIYLEPKTQKRAHRANGILHLNAAFFILKAVAERLIVENRAISLFTLLEVVVGVAYIVLFVKQLRHQHTSHQARVSWLEIVGAAIFYIEGMHKMHAGADYIQYAYFGLSILYLLMGLFYRKLMQHRYLHLDALGFSGRLSVLRSVKFRWQDIKELRSNNNKLIVLDQDNQEKLLNFNFFSNAQTAISTLIDYFYQSKQAQEGTSQILNKNQIG